MQNNYNEDTKQNIFMVHTEIWDQLVYKIFSGHQILNDLLICGNDGALIHVSHSTTQVQKV